MSLKKGRKASGSDRQHHRFAYVEDLTIVYEGRGEKILLRAPDISPGGMFINTAQLIPEGAVLKISFRLPASDFEVKARGEVRYCLPGVGVGVEFVDITAEAREAIKNGLRAMGVTVTAEA